MVFSGLIMGCTLNTAVAPPAILAAPPPITVECEAGFQWPDKDLQSRFQQYWTLLKAGNSAGSFEYEAPHVREMVVWGKYERYSDRVKSDWISIRVQKINKISDQLIEVDFIMVTKSKEKAGAKRDLFFRDSWLFFTGKWFHVLKDPFVTGDELGK